MKSVLINKKYSIKISILELLELIKQLNIDDKVLIEKELEKETLKYRSLKLTQRIKKNNISIDEIVSEVKKLRAKQ